MVSLTLETSRVSDRTAETSLFCSACGVRLEAPAQSTPARCTWCDREVGGG